MMTNLFGVALLVVSVGTRKMKRKRVLPLSQDFILWPVVKIPLCLGSECRNMESSSDLFGRCCADWDLDIPPCCPPDGMSHFTYICTRAHVHHTHYTDARTTRTTHTHHTHTHTHTHHIHTYTTYTPHTHTYNTWTLNTHNCVCVSIKTCTSVVCVSVFTKAHSVTHDGCLDICLYTDICLYLYTHTYV